MFDENDLDEKINREDLVKEGLLTEEQFDILDKYDIIDGIIYILNGNGTINICRSDFKHVTNNSKIVSVYTSVDGVLMETKISDEEPDCGLISVRISINDNLEKVNEVVMEFNKDEIPILLGCSIDGNYTFGIKTKRIDVK